MPNKPRNWTDVKLIISSFSIAITLGAWGIFASHEKTGTGVTGEAAVPSQPDPLVSDPPSPALLPGQILLFGGTNLQPPNQPQTQVQAQPTQTVIVRKKHGGRGDGGGGGGGGGGGVTSSGYSHP